MQKSPGDTEHGPCDADDVFSVRELVRRLGTRRVSNAPNVPS